LETKVTERLVCRLWQSCRVRHPVADTGEPLDIIFPGRVSNRGGCDFKDAVFVLNGHTVCGDVEVHVKSSQWQGHGHHQDPKYNDIALHVVWQRDSRAVTHLQNGKAIPTICLGAFITSTLGEMVTLPPCSPSTCPSAATLSNSDIIDTLLVAAGVNRFKAKVASFRKALNNEHAAQVVYRGIARALGYTQNAGPCQELAQRLPITELARKSAVSYVQTLLLGHAGLLPSQRYRPVRDRAAARLEKIWRSTGATGTMKETDWCFFRVRPDNFPTRRLIALSHLISRYHQQEMASGILSLIKRAPAGAEHRWLENGLVVAIPGYWQNHFDFGIATSRDSALVGCEKASAIALNTVLPFAAAYAELAPDPGLKRKTVGVYRRYPGRGDNELTRYMKQQLGLRPDIRLSACQQQGLIHLFQAYCRHRNCSKCPISSSPG
jgi:hypothetical protein